MINLTKQVETDAQKNNAMRFVSRALYRNKKIHHFILGREIITSVVFYLEGLEVELEGIIVRLTSVMFLQYFAIQPKSDAPLNPIS